MAIRYSHGKNQFLVSTLHGKKIQKGVPSVYGYEVLVLWDFGFIGLKFYKFITL